MKKNRLSLAFLSLLIAASPLRAQDTLQNETVEQKDKRMEWFSQAKLGIFIHWGIYSVRGVSESWSFFNNYLPYDEYMEQEKGFTASKYDPKAWVDLIKESGAKYTVITTKHHDGVALWDTIVDLLRSDNKNVIINSRIQGYGDYATPEQGVPVVRPEDKYWELCMTMNDSWGYQHTDSNYKSPYILLRTFVDCLSMGGNLLLDIGPKEDGSIPEEQIAVLKEFGRWTKKHKEAIYETRAGIPTEHFQGYTTLNKAGDILYLYLPYKPNGPVEVKGLMNKVNRIWVVGNGAMLNYKVYNKNYWNSVPGNLYIDVPQQVQDEQITVLAVLLDGPIKLYRGVGQVQDNN